MVRRRWKLVAAAIAGVLVLTLAAGAVVFLGEGDEQPPPRLTRTSAVEGVARIAGGRIETASVTADLSALRSDKPGRELNGLEGRSTNVRSAPAGREGRHVHRGPARRTCISSRPRRAIGTFANGSGCGPSRSLRWPT